MFDPQLLRRRLLCQPVTDTLPPLSPRGAWQRLISWAMSYEEMWRNYYVAMTSKYLRLPDAVKVVNTLGLAVCRDVHIYPPPCGPDRYRCDPDMNTALAYLFPAIDRKPGGVKLFVPPQQYMTSPRDVDEAIFAASRGTSDVRVFIVSKFASLGRLESTVNKLPGRVVIASRGVIGVRRVGKATIVETKSHRKIIVVVTRSNGHIEVTVMHGSMNYLYPGTDDYMVAVTTWQDAKPILHGLVRAFLAI